MTMLQINSAIELDQVLEGIKKLDTPELEDFFAQVSMVVAGRKAPSIPQQESVLLQKINQPLSTDILTEYQKLSQKQRNDQITPDENDRLLDLVDVLEQADAERMQHLLELAQLRKLPLDKLIQQLGIRTPAVHG